MASFFHTDKWKKIVAKLYGFGAALVIIGALFKLQHWAGAGYMLSVGMFTEFIIFIISAFEPVPKEYEWETVFPELDDNTFENKRTVPSLGLSRTSSNLGTSSAVSTGEGHGGSVAIDPDTANELKQTVGRFNKAVVNLGALNAISSAAESLVDGVQQAAGKMPVLNQSMASLNEAYKQAAHTITAGGKQVNSGFEVLNRHLSAVNASYELYVQGHQQYAASTGQWIDAMKTSAEKSRQIVTQMESFNTRIGDLNTIYGSMLSAVNVALKK